jgi:GTP-binding protein Era
LDEHQLIFLDTPGLHKPKNRLGDFMVKVIRDTVSDVDTVMLVVEPVPRIGIPEQMLLEQIREFGMPAVLVINKVDTLKDKESLLETIAVYTQEYDFEAVVPVSALTGDGMDQLTEELKKLCFESPQLFPDDMISDQPERQLVAELIREKLLENLDKEVPHGVAVEIEQYKERDNGIMDVSAVIYCERKTHKGIIIGKGGAMLKKIGAAARQECEELLDAKVFLQLWVKVKEEWRNNPALIRNFGYEQE